MIEIALFSVTDEIRLAQAIALRIRVFVEEQAVPIALEIDEHDREGSRALHAIASEGARVLGTGRSFRRDDDTVQIGRMAVDASARARGIGGALLLRLMEDARASGFSTAALDAQEHALGFYERHGFSVVGPHHLDAGIVHFPMRAPLRPIR